MKPLRCAEMFARKGNLDFIAKSCIQCQELPNHVECHYAGAEVDNTLPALTGPCPSSLRHLFNCDNLAALKNNPGDRSARQTKRDMPSAIRFMKLDKRCAPVFVNLFCEKTSFTLTVFCCFIQIIPLLMNLKHQDKYLAELFDYAGGATVNTMSEVFSSASPDELSLQMM